MSEIDYLRKFYEGISRSCSLTELDIPPSPVFYVHRALADRTGLCYNVEHVYVAMFLEGHINPYKHFINGLPQWYVDKYLRGKHPDMDALREKLRILYQRHLNAITVSAEHSVEEADIGEVK